MTEDKLIKDFLKKKKTAWEAEDKLRSHFNSILDDILPTCKTEDDFHNVKVRMSDMPESASKVLIFHRILLHQNKMLKY